MATLNVNNNIVAIFREGNNFVYDTCTETPIYLDSSSPNIVQPLSTDPYLGLNKQCSALSNNGELYAVAEGKQLSIWCTRDWTKKKVKTLERSASKMIFTPSNRTIIVADKTGDVYSFALMDDSIKGTLLMGHLSILLDVAMPSNEKFIVTCDRDEKIRVTCYPNTYNIRCFCLDHTAFVTRILLLDDEVLLSSSGDGTLKLWHYLNGKCFLSYSVIDDVTQSEKKSEIDRYIITNVVTLRLSSFEVIMCISIHNFNGLLVYDCRYDSNSYIKLVQYITCDEPLDFATHGRHLWILNISCSNPLDVFLWNEHQFVKFTDNHTRRISDAVKNQCTYLGDCSHSDLTVLSKMYDLKEAAAKRIKLS